LNNNPTPNKRPTVPPQKPGTNPSANKSAPNAGANRPAQGGAHGKKTIKFNKDIGLALLALLLVVALAITIIVCCIKAIVDTVRGDGQTTTPEQTVNTAGTTTGTPVQTDPVFTTPVVGAWNEGYTTVSRANTAVNEGDLILVNYQYAYTFPTSINLKEMYGQTGFGSVYVLGNGMTYPNGTTKSLELSKHIIPNLTAMLSEMKNANASLTSERRLMILSGYRTYEKQQSLYENETVEGLTAKPGFSEHHTGLTFDIRISLKNSSEIEYLNDAEQKWIETNCAKYGFILRYTDENKDITGILNEDWHFRYVGVPHAMYMVENDLCLEEYLDFLRKNHHYGTHDPLNYTVGETTYTIYYFPASVEKTTTNIYVPSAGYEISGNNVDGFIVTVTKNS
jgi:D-alanyl-D-alanine carboxypeptidase